MKMFAPSTVLALAGRLTMRSLLPSRTPALERLPENASLKRQIALTKRHLVSQGWTLEPSWDWLNVFVRASRNGAWLNLAMYESGTLSLKTIISDTYDSIKSSGRSDVFGILFFGNITAEDVATANALGIFLVSPAQLSSVEAEIRNTKALRMHGRLEEAKKAGDSSEIPASSLHSESKGDLLSSSENVRLVIWDLDETFWSGTLSEGGAFLDPRCKTIVETLTDRGILNSICSKNDVAQVHEVLQSWGIWDYFVFPSVSWEAKGPRLKALVDEVQLRPESILFIDDNEMNLREARHFLPSIQVANVDFLDRMLLDPRLQGKADPTRSRLAQYKLLQEKKRVQLETNGDNTEFLRASGIVVHFEFDIEKHLDRAIELINRTNQLNFTKTRLSENVEEARNALRQLISKHWVQAALIRVSDDFGDYGLVGLYVVSRPPNGAQLLHFCFSCRILNMGVERWVYNFLSRPGISIKGPVALDLKADTSAVDWITVSGTKESSSKSGCGRPVYLRGGCDLRAIAHYLSPHFTKVIDEVSETVGGLELRTDHSTFYPLLYGPVSSVTKSELERLGYGPQCFESSLHFLTVEPATVVLSFWADAHVHIYRNRETGLEVPVHFPQYIGADLTRVSASDFDRTVKSERASNIHAVLCADYQYIGPISRQKFSSNVERLLATFHRESTVFIILHDPGTSRASSAMTTNIAAWLTELARDDDRVRLMRLAQFRDSMKDLHDGDHYDRMVYFRAATFISNPPADTSLFYSQTPGDSAPMKET